ncbi:MAG: NifU N-terminal domain-containing protein [Candidatus Sericytochromatia bacterium]
MYIDIEYTPNPNARKFVLEKNVLSKGSKQFNSRNEAEDDILASELFKVDGVESVFFFSNFITISKSDNDTNWRFIETEVKNIINENQEYFNNLEKGNTYNKDDENLKRIEEILNDTVRPGLAMDGGGLEVMGLSEDMKLSVKYHGACGSCPSSTYATLTAINNILREEFNPKIEVVAV